MGFFDDVTASFNRGVASVGRTADSTKLKLQQSELLKQRKELAAQLGASLYELTKADPSFTTGREALYEGIASIDQQRAAIDVELQRLDQEAAAQAQAALVYTCPKCGGTVRQGDLFCSGCGTPASEIIPPQQSAPAAPAATGAVCVHCGAPINPGDAFCMSCGGKQDVAPTE